jgi:hypothetical protein
MGLRILFLCGAIESGRDGVGDYVMCLAMQLQKMNHSVSIIALKDEFVSEPIENKNGISSLRLPSAMSANERFSLAEQWITTFEPQVISLQYVPYSYHHKGIPLGLVKRLKPLIGKAKFHLMLHELWLDKPENIKQQLVLWVQKYIVGKCVSELKPSVVNVSIPYNKKRLSDIGISANELPLFGNIIPSTEPLTTEHTGELNGTFKLLYFGTSPRGEFIDVISKGIALFLKNRVGTLEFSIACGNGSSKDNFINVLKQQLSGYDIKYVDCGFLEVEEISKLMSTCDVGIARSEPYLLGKSGSAIAMLEHGMAIWLPKMEVPDVVEYAFRTNLIFSSLEEAAKSVNRLPYSSLLPSIAEQFIHQFNTIKK